MLVKKIGIIDAGCGNIKSVALSFQIEGSVVNILSNSPKKDDYDLIVLPGVGAAGTIEKSLKNKFKSWIKDRVSNQKPFLGICLGFQLMFEGTQESGGIEGFSFFQGVCQPLNDYENINLRVGWYKLSKNKVTLDNEINSFYFNHSFGVNKKVFLRNNKCISSSIENSVALAVDKNLYGLQFHPEKSQISGNKLIKDLLLKL
tara:strand:- start:106 stop:711 length:606 start_codon:yes stop_codon:yes gene_type:complete